MENTVEKLKRMLNANYPADSNACEITIAYKGLDATTDAKRKPPENTDGFVKAMNC